MGYDAEYPGIDAEVIGDFNDNGVFDLSDVEGFSEAVAGQRVGRFLKRSRASEYPLLLTSATTSSA